MEEVELLGKRLLHLNDQVGRLEDFSRRPDELRAVLAVLLVLVAGSDARGFLNHDPVSVRDVTPRVVRGQAYSVLVSLNLFWYANRHAERITRLSSDGDEHFAQASHETRRNKREAFEGSFGRSMMDQHTPRLRRRFLRSRRRFLLVAALAIGVVFGLGAQAAGPDGAASLSLADLDLSSASIHQAGPASFYVRGVTVDDESYSFLMEQSETAVWSIVRIIPESANILPPDSILDFATISVSDGSTIQIDGVLVGNSVYGGSLSVGEDADLELAEQIRRTSDTTINEARSEALRAIILAETQAEFDAAVAEQRVALEAIIDRVEAERDALAAENDRLAAERDALQAERDRLESELGAGGEIGAAEPSDGGEAVGDGPRVSPLSGERVESLIRERDQLAGDIVGLVMENNELRDERKTLREQIEGLQTRNTELREDVETMTSEIDRLEELVAAYRSTIGSEPGADPVAGAGADEASDAGDPAAEPEGPPPGWTFPGDYVKTADLEAAARAVTGELQSLERRVAALETAAVGLARLEEELRTGVRGGLPGTRLASEPAGGLPGATGPGAGPAEPEPEAAPEETAPAAASRHPSRSARPHRARDRGRRSRRGGGGRTGRTSRARAGRARRPAR